MWTKIGRQWLSAYELLHIAAYRLIGRRYTRQEGAVVARSGEVLTRSQQLFCLLFPALVTLGIMLILAVVWIYTYTQFFSHIEPRAYYFTAPGWHIALQLLLFVLPLFAAPAYFDLRRALRLLTEPAQQPPEQTPHQERKWKRPQ
ncbi:MAG: hypothetical protein HC802_12895 [Caldilineaceae bacterium]|nr:hypothetical protein [Caldilineaceae bacterium]